MKRAVTPVPPQYCTPSSLSRSLFVHYTIIVVVVVVVVGVVVVVVGAANIILFLRILQK
jgi:uncharacterized membrane protein